MRTVSYGVSVRETVRAIVLLSLELNANADRETERTVARDRGPRSDAAPASFDPFRRLGLFEPSVPSSTFAQFFLAVARDRLDALLGRARSRAPAPPPLARKPTTPLARGCAVWPRSDTQHLGSPTARRASCARRRQR